MPYEDSQRRHSKEKIIRLVSIAAAAIIGIVALLLLTKGRGSDSTDLEKDEAYRRGLYDRSPFENPEDDGE